jgi:hypothetical protein
MHWLRARSGPGGCGDGEGSPDTAEGGGRVLIVERLIPEEPGDAVPTLLSGINMLVITGGRSAPTPNTPASWRELA